MIFSPPFVFTSICRALDISTKETRLVDDTRDERGSWLPFLVALRIAMSAWSET